MKIASFFEGLCHPHSLVGDRAPTLRANGKEAIFKAMTYHCQPFLIYPCHCESATGGRSNPISNKRSAEGEAFLPGDRGCPPKLKFPQDWGIQGVDDSVGKRSS